MAKKTIDPITIYQIFTRLYGNGNTSNIPGGSLNDNGCGKMNGFTEARLERIRDFGFTHVWFTGLLEHATQTDYTAHGIAKDNPCVVKGKAGSPYAIKDYYDIDPDLATDPDRRMEEFEALLQRTHNAGLKLIMDFVPNHVARRYHSDARPAGTKDLGEDDNTDLAFSPANNFYYVPGEELHTDFCSTSQENDTYKEFPARATGNDRFDAWPQRNDWYETIKLNYGIDYCNGRAQHFDPIPGTWKKMTDILLFWCAKGVDAFRCDMAELVPCAFWHHAIGQVKSQYPAVQFIAEVYNPAEYRNYIHQGGFDFLYDKVGLYDALRAVVCNVAPASCITGCWQSTDDIRHHMLYFLENHDEQRIASDFFAANAAKGRPALVVGALMGSNPFMVYAGQEIGERGMDEEGFSGRDGRTTIFDYWNPDSMQKLGGNLKKLSVQEKELYDYYKKILHIRLGERAANKGLFYDLMYVNYDGKAGFNSARMYAFLRTCGSEALLIVANFDENDKEAGVRIPAHAFDFLGIKPGNRRATELITSATTPISLKPDDFTTINVLAHNAVILKFRK